MSRVVILGDPPRDIPARYDREFMERVLKHVRELTREVEEASEIQSRPTRAQFVVEDFVATETYTLSDTSVDVSEVRRFLLGLADALQRKGLVRAQARPADA